MTWTLIAQAAAATYLLSVIVFFVMTYMGAGERAERVTYALLWPIYLVLIGIAVITGIINELASSLLDLLWPDDEEDEDDDFDEDGGFA